MQKHTRKVALAAVIAAALTATPAVAGTASRWSRFDAVRTTSKVTRVVVRTRCLGAEDSAAALRLIDYGNGRAVYGCARSGY